MHKKTSSGEEELFIQSRSTGTSLAAPNEHKFKQRTSSHREKNASPFSRIAHLHRMRGKMNKKCGYSSSVPGIAKN